MKSSKSQNKCEEPWLMCSEQGAESVAQKNPVAGCGCKGGLQSDQRGALFVRMKHMGFILWTVWFQQVSELKWWFQSC